MDKNEELLEMDRLFDRLFPICRSITGPGLRKTLNILSEYVPLEHFQVATGTPVFDWVIPEEWHIRDAYLRGPGGEIVADFKDNNLHVVNYSIPVNQKLSLHELKEHLHTIPSLPEAIPYVTSYYKKRWGFCIPYKVFKQLAEGEYHAYIDSELKDGQLNFSHAVLPGESKREILISTYVCHPSMANNELSGPLVAAYLYRRLSSWNKRRFTYRFVFVPETIGSIAYLHRFGGHLRDYLHAGIVLTCLGGKNSLSYKQSRSGNSPIDFVWNHLLECGVMSGQTRPFTPAYGSDERQYCSPGFNFPVGQMARTVYGSYVGYHNSLDTKEEMRIEILQQSVDELERLLQAVEIEGYYVNQFPYGEVKLDKYGLYPDINSPTLTGNLSSNEVSNNRTRLNQIMTILNYADGEHSLVDIAKLCGCSLEHLTPLVNLLISKNIITGPYIGKGMGMQ